VLAVFHQLGSDPDRARTTERWSPGEERKLLLALGTLDAPALLLLDEPTNHLDLPSILALEAALAEQQTAMVLVTHDQRFATAVTNSRWEIRGGPESVVNVS
jgi:ATPase subunit of ABC transporter with duplicated ATPase domains